MIRQIIKIDRDQCNGCGLCVNACHEGAIGLENGKAVLLRDDYCDGLGNCLPVCPTGAITFEMREADEFDVAAVQAKMNEVEMADQPQKQAEKLPCGCPGSQSRTIKHHEPAKHQETAKNQDTIIESASVQSQLNQWPVQIQLVPVNAPYFNGANLLIAADCAAYAYGNFHNEFMRNKITLIGCPKLDECDYSQKLTAILKQNNIKSVTVVRMQVPCCGGLANATISALQNCGKMIPWQLKILSTDGNIIE